MDGASSTRLVISIKWTIYFYATYQNLRPSEGQEFQSYKMNGKGLTHFMRQKCFEQWTLGAAI